MNAVELPKFEVWAEWMSGKKEETGWHNSYPSGKYTPIYKMELTFNVIYDADSTHEEKIDAIVKAYQETFNVK